MQRGHIFSAINRERGWQDGKWGDNPHEVGGWLTIMRRELREAEDAWCTSRGNDDALREILQVIAVGIACLEQYGVVERMEIEAWTARGTREETSE
jgi:hypothetical protein